MSNRGEEFEVSVWGSPDGYEFSSLDWESWSKLTKESSAYLRSIGYKARAKVLVPQFGSAGGYGLISSIIESISRIIPPIRLAVLIFKVLSDRYARAMLLSSSKSRVNMKVDIYYKSRLKKWATHGNPDNASKKLESMLDASLYLHEYISNKYPNVVFDTSVDFSLDEGRSSIGYSLSHSQVTAVNVARLKKTCSQTVILKHTNKHIGISKGFPFFGLFIKRVDSSISRQRVYFLLLPSMLIRDANKFRRIIKHKMKQGEV